MAGMGSNHSNHIVYSLNHEALQAIRLREGRSYGYIGSKCGRSRHTIRAIFAGVSRDPSATLLAAIMETLREPMASVLTRTEVADGIDNS